jgi:short-subunit dehydrogenase
MLGFSNGLQADLAGTEYKVSAVVLGKVDSPYFKNNPISESKVPRISNILVPTMTVDEAGQVVFDTVKSKRKMVIKPTIMAVFVFFNRLFPRVFIQLMQIK